MIEDLIPTFLFLMHVSDRLRHVSVLPIETLETAATKLATEAGGVEGSLGTVGIGTFLGVGSLICLLGDLQGTRVERLVLHRNGLGNLNKLNY